GECTWASQNRTGYTGIGEQFPQWCPLPSTDNSRLRQHILCRFESAEREIGQIRFGIAANEIKYAVSSGISSGGERRPGYWSLRRISCMHSAVRTLFTELGEVGQFTSRKHRLYDTCFEAVEP